MAARLLGLKEWRKKPKHRYLSKSKSGSLSKSKQHDSWTRKVGRLPPLDRLRRLGGRGYCVQEDTERYGQEKFDPDPDSDFDPEEIKTNQSNLLDDLDRKHK